MRGVDYERGELFAIWHTLMYDLRRVAKLFDGNTKKLAFQPFNVNMNPMSPNLINPVVALLKLIAHNAIQTL